MAKPKMTRSALARRTTSVDHHVGAQTRERRSELGMSQTELAHACGITFQQVQKYENGANRVSASRLWQFAAILDKPIDYFFDGLPPHKLSASVMKSIDAERKSSVDRTPSGKIDPDTLRIARMIASSPDAKLKQRLKTMLTTLSVS